MHAILAGPIPGGPYPPPTPNFTWLAWCIVAFVTVGLLCRLANRRRR